MRKDSECIILRFKSLDCWTCETNIKSVTSTEISKEADGAEKTTAALSVQAEAVPDPWSIKKKPSGVPEASAALSIKPAAVPVPSISKDRIRPSEELWWLRYGGRATSITDKKTSTKSIKKI